MTTLIPLEIPDAAYRALHAAGDEPMRDYVTAIAAPVVAAELLRLVTWFEEYSKSTASGTNRAGFRAAALILRERADVLAQVAGAAIAADG